MPIVYLFLLLFCLQGCVKKNTMPDAYFQSNMQATVSIKKMREVHIPGAFEKWVGDDVITGIVIANDATDNFYKCIVIQDSTAGITVKLDGFSLSADYPLYHRVFIRLNGLWLCEYGGMLQLGAGIDISNPPYADLMPLPVPLFGKHIVVGSMESPPVPISVGFDALKDSLQSRLVQLNGVELVTPDTAKPYADVFNKATVSHSVQFCTGGVVYLRTGGFAKFAAVKTPKGNGSLQGIYTIFGSQKQIQIRDTSDIRMNNPRCANNVPKQLLYEDFEAVAVNQPIQIVGWKNIAESGTQTYIGKLQANNRFAEITCFASGNNSASNWLISPPINLSNSSNEQLSFVTKDAFDNGAILQVLISSNYDGGAQPWKAKWVPLKANISKGATNAQAINWVSSGKMSLSGYSGTVYIAFRYEGADVMVASAKKTTSFQLDEVKITGN